MKKFKVGVVPAAGKGKRISDLPLTKILPKPMLPVLNSPILEYVIKNMKRVGIETIYLIVGHKKERIQEYFKNGEDWGIDIDYIKQEDCRGVAHAISLAEDCINEPFMTILGDDLTITKSLDNLVEIFWRNSALAVEGIVPENDIEVLRGTCCVVLSDKGKIKGIVEKPLEPKTNLRGTGIYLFDPAIFDYIDKTPISAKYGKKEITDAIALIAKEGRAYGAFINGTNINVNTFRDLRLATELVLLRFSGGVP